MDIAALLPLKNARQGGSEAGGTCRTQCTSGAGGATKTRSIAYQRWYSAQQLKLRALLRDRLGLEERDSPNCLAGSWHRLWIGEPPAYERCQEQLGYSLPASVVLQEPYRGKPVRDDAAPPFER